MINYLGSKIIYSAPNKILDSNNPASQIVHVTLIQLFENKAGKLIAITNFYCQNVPTSSGIYLHNQTLSKLLIKQCTLKNCSFLAGLALGTLYFHVNKTF